MRREDILSFEEIVDVAQCAVGLGFVKIRLTGGEPLVRRNIETLVGLVADINGLADLTMTTNGLLLSKYAQALADAGLRRVNVSLNAIDPDSYATITRGGDVRRVLAGIDAARLAGLNPIKINCVVESNDEDRNAKDVAEYAEREGFEVRFIRQMNLAAGSFEMIEGGSGGNCPICNRLRLTSDGQIRPCLFSDLSFSLRRFGAAEAIMQAVANKPQAGSTCSNRPLHTIGG